MKPYFRASRLPGVDMATKKQKRAAALAKREEYLEQKRIEDLGYQRQGREADERRAEAIRSASRKYEERLKGILVKYYNENKGKRPCEHDGEGNNIPRNSNICAAEGCFNEACLDIQKEFMTND